MLSLLRLVLAAVIVTSLAAAASSWAIPIEVAQGLAIQRAGEDRMAKVEAFGRAEALGWSLRIASLVVFALSVFGLRRSHVLADYLRQAAGDLGDATDFVREGEITAHPRRTRLYRLLGIRTFVAAWFLLAAFHQARGLWMQIEEWPWYRMRPGSESLPNISDANRDVIRYLTRVTPPDAKILVCTDQKPFFLSYYLLPRRLYHRMHPDSEFVIPRPGTSRPLTAYRPEDLDPESIRQLQPDYILEYYEGPQYLDPTRLTEDAQWIEHQRWYHGIDYVPQFLVSLHPFQGELPW